MAAAVPPAAAAVEATAEAVAAAEAVVEVHLPEAAAVAAVADIADKHKRDIQNKVARRSPYLFYACA